MVRRSKVTETLRQQVVQMKAKGMTLSAIAREVGRSKSVISRILHLYNVTNSFKSPKKAGRPRKTNAREDRVMRRMSMGNRFNTAAGIARQFSAVHGKDLSRHTVSRRLRAFGLKAYSAVTKPLISRKNQKARLAFAEEHVVWTEENWSKVHFSDESKFNLFGSDGKHYVRRQTGERLNPKCVKKSVKGGGGSVMVWGMFSAAGVGPLIQLHGRVNANVYQNLLRQHVVPPLRSSPNQPAIFMQDNAPCHTAKRVKQFLETENIEIMKWPAQSPDLNPIENLWKILGDKVMAKKPTTVTELWKRLEEEWTKVTPEQCERLVMSCGRRCAEVIQNNGLYTSY